MQEVAKRAVLVSVANFEPGVSLGARHGAKEDTRRLHRVLSKLDFQVDIHQDLNSHEIYRLFRKVPCDHLHQSNVTTCVLGADGAPVWLSRVFAYFDRADVERMAKVFLIQVAGLPSGGQATPRDSLCGLQGSPQSVSQPTADALSDVRTVGTAGRHPPRRPRTGSRRGPDLHHALLPAAGSTGVARLRQGLDQGSRGPRRQRHLCLQASRTPIPARQRRQRQADRRPLHARTQPDGLHDLQVPDRCGWDGSRGGHQINEGMDNECLPPSTQGRAHPRRANGRLPEDGRWSGAYGSFPPGAESRRPPEWPDYEGPRHHWPPHIHPSKYPPQYEHHHPNQPPHNRPQYERPQRGQPPLLGSLLPSPPTQPPAHLYGQALSRAASQLVRPRNVRPPPSPALTRYSPRWGNQQRGEDEGWG
ncbi:uncharacterized protein LOC133489907 isoform X7 [Phyllopteryx taeniolatus]|uniref:uncharacterized protein LOC133489907 isoform X7 n=1 Tax=Phyllopteryx taeniolatus TaxID=161469 RepID=UPI002AD241F4|nr:uncharacterized protein LOC133489907 isoform X7 [Phyllopteryx taeniolatus]